MNVLETTQDLVNKVSGNAPKPISVKEGITPRHLGPGDRETTELNVLLRETLLGPNHAMQVSVLYRNGEAHGGTRE